MVVFDSVSKSKATKQVAHALGEPLKEGGGGLEVDVQYCKEVQNNAVLNYDCVIAGAPTMAFRPSKNIGQFLDSLRDMDFKGKRAAAFDTQLQSRFSGNAAKGIEDKLRGLGFSIFKEPLVAYVESKVKDEWLLKAGELEKVRIWSQEAANALKA